MTPEADGECWHLVVDPAWPGFAGHFPDDPILPAAELIGQALHCAAARGLTVCGIRKARFVQAVRPGDRLRWELDTSRETPRLRAHVEHALACELWLLSD